MKLAGQRVPVAIGSTNFHRLCRARLNPELGKALGLATHKAHGRLGGLHRPLPDHDLGVAVIPANANDAHYLGRHTVPFLFTPGTIEGCLRCEQSGFAVTHTWPAARGKTPVSERWKRRAGE